MSNPAARRALAAVAVALVCGRLAWILADPKLYTPDFHFYWRGARLWLDGVDPYAMRPRGQFWRLWPLWDRLFYPLPALMLTAPFTALTIRAGQAALIGAASGALAFLLTRSAWWPLLLFLTPSFWFAAFLGQWSPWLTLGALVPWAGFLLAAKPTLGLACFAYRPTWRAVASGLAIVALSLVLMPRWPALWLANLRTVQGHRPPILMPGGFLIALALFRWRTPEARLLLAMACVPQLLFFADQLPLFLVARTRREAALLVVSSAVCAAAWALHVAQADAVGPLAEPYVLLGCYAPALYVVLRRPQIPPPSMCGASGGASPPCSAL